MYVLWRIFDIRSCVGSLSTLTNRKKERKKERKLSAWEREYRNTREGEGY